MGHGTRTDTQVSWQRGWGQRGWELGVWSVWPEGHTPGLEFHCTPSQCVTHEDPPTCAWEVSSYGGLALVVAEPQQGSLRGRLDPFCLLAMMPHELGTG
jgi:hypothetical protein